MTDILIAVLTVVMTKSLFFFRKVQPFLSADGKTAYAFQDNPFLCYILPIKSRFVIKKLPNFGN